MADQLRAAKDFAGRFSGKYISVGWLLKLFLIR
jgi:hypothetical protein